MTMTFSILRMSKIRMSKIRMSQTEFVARVIYSEAGPQCSDWERYYVASVIKNRIKRQGFGRGKLSTMFEVVTEKNAFSCVPKHNSNWDNFDINDPICKLCLKLAKGEFKPVPDIVYYHDLSIDKPKCWDNKYYTAIPKKHLKHFIFYSIIENKIINKIKIRKFNI